jgi:hypothetical protein
MDFFFPYICRASPTHPIRALLNSSVLVNNVYPPLFNNPKAGKHSCWLSLERDFLEFSWSQGCLALPLLPQERRWSRYKTPQSMEQGCCNEANMEHLGKQKLGMGSMGALSASAWEILLGDQHPFQSLVVMEENPAKP